MEGDAGELVRWDYCVDRERADVQAKTVRAPSLQRPCCLKRAMLSVS